MDEWKKEVKKRTTSDVYDKTKYIDGGLGS